MATDYDAHRPPAPGEELPEAVVTELAEPRRLQPTIEDD